MNKITNSTPIQNMKTSPTPDELQERRRGGEITDEMAASTEISPAESIAGSLLREFRNELAGYDDEVSWKWLEEEVGRLGKKLAELNDRYAVLVVGGNVIVADTASIGYKPKLVRVAYERQEDDEDISFPLTYTFGDFEKMYENIKFRLPKRTKAGVTYYDTNLVKFWREYKGRRQFIEGYTFKPNAPHVTHSVLNIWNGWGVQPMDPKLHNHLGVSEEHDDYGWNRLRRHLRSTVCGGDEDCFNFALDWMADILQNPLDKKGTAIVIRGKKGSGKSTVGEYLSQIIGKRWTVALSNKNQLTARFNGHIGNSLLILSEEATYAGDKGLIGDLKHLITGSTLLVERKHLDAKQQKSFTRFMFTSNEDWTIDASEDERRFLVLDCADTYADQEDESVRSYWDKLHHQMQHMKGVNFMIHELLHRQITSNLRKPPRTEALNSQILHSLDVSQRWFVEKLINQNMPDRDDKGYVDRKVLYDDYCEHCNAKRYGDRFANDQTFGLNIKKWWFAESKRVNDAGGGKKTVYLLPSDDEIRQAIQEVHKIDVDLLGGLDGDDDVETEPATVVTRTAVPSTRRQWSRNF